MEATWRSSLVRFDTEAPISLVFPSRESEAFFGCYMERPKGRRRVYWTPSFFCRLVEDVVYWNTSF
jgi:hypothetical protein